VRVFIGLEILMPYVFYKGALLTHEEYEKVKDELDKKEQEYLKLLLGEELESKEGEGPDEASPTEVAESSEEPLDHVETVGHVESVVDSADSQEVHPNAEGGDKADSGEPEVRRTRRKRQS
jgi:hypothetical protein